MNITGASRSFGTHIFCASDIQKGDFFGLDLMESLEKEAIYLVVKHDYQEELEVEVSLDGGSWVSKLCTGVHLSTNINY